MTLLEEWKIGKLANFKSLVNIQDLKKQTPTK